MQQFCKCTFSTMIWLLIPTEPLWFLKVSLYACVQPSLSAKSQDLCLSSTKPSCVVVSSVEITAASNDRNLT